MKSHLVPHRRDYARRSPLGNMPKIVPMWPCLAYQNNFDGALAATVHVMIRSLCASNFESENGMRQPCHVSMHHVYVNIT